MPADTVDIVDDRHPRGGLRDLAVLAGVLLLLAVVLVCGFCRCCQKRKKPTHRAMSLTPRDEEHADSQSAMQQEIHGTWVEEDDDEVDGGTAMMPAWFSWMPPQMLQQMILNHPVQYAAVPTGAVQNGITERTLQPLPSQQQLVLPPSGSPLRPVSHVPLELQGCNVAKRKLFCSADQTVMNHGSRVLIQSQQDLVEGERQRALSAEHRAADAEQRLRQAVRDRDEALARATAAEQRSSSSPSKSPQGAIADRVRQVLQAPKPVDPLSLPEDEGGVTAAQSVVERLASSKIAAEEAKADLEEVLACAALAEQQMLQTTDDSISPSRGNGGERMPQRTTHKRGRQGIQSGKSNGRWR